MSTLVSTLDKLDAHTVDVQFAADVLSVAI